MVKGIQNQLQLARSQPSAMLLDGDSGSMMGLDVRILFPWGYSPWGPFLGIQNHFNQMDGSCFFLFA